MTHVIQQLEKDFAHSIGIRREDWDSGFDINLDLVKATKMYMVMNNDGGGNIFQTNSLLPPHEWTGEKLRNHNTIGFFQQWLLFRSIGMGMLSVKMCLN